MGGSLGKVSLVSETSEVTVLKNDKTKSAGVFIKEQKPYMDYNLIDKQHYDCYYNRGLELACQLNCYSALKINMTNQLISRL